MFFSHQQTSLLLVIKQAFLGAQAAARDVGRVLVCGHAPNVGIVGWSIGGGHGQLVPLHGMGVDQVSL